MHRARLTSALTLLLVSVSTLAFCPREDGVRGSDGLGAVCWVNLYDDTQSSGWTFTGNSPYLHDSLDSYIMSLTAANCSWFHFQDTNVTDLQNVFLMVEWKTRDVLAGKEAKLYLHDGVSEINLGSFDLTLEYRWTEINITSVMETVTKVNSAKLKIASLYASFYHIAVRRAYLRIFNGPVPVKTGTVEWGRPGGQITLAVKWTDPDGLSSYALSHNASGSWLPQNLTEMLTGTEAWSNHTITLQLDTISVLAYRFWANDTNGNWEKTDVLYVYPVRSFNPDALRYIADVQDSSISHGYGRKDFYDIQTGRFWKFYSDGVNMKFTSTTDGQTWTPSQAVRTAAYGFTFYVHVSEGIVHYVYCSESPSADVFYRKGYLNMDGTIAWAASEQVAVDAGTSAKFYACSVVSDDNGCPYIIFGNRTNSNLKTLKLVKSDLNNGAWHTATGYPMQINESPDTDLLSGVALDLPNNEIYVVYCSAGNEEPPIGRLLQSDVLGPQENASDYTMPINYPFSAVSDKSGNVHVAYRRANGRIDYSFRNYSTGSWEIKDELVTSYVTNEVLGSTVYSWPVIGCADSRVNPHLEEVYVHWWTLEDKSAWLEIRNTTGWEPRKRILRLDKDYTLIDGDVVVERARQREILLDFVVQNVTDERVELWAYIQANRLPVATFTESAETANTGEAITFNASESYDLDGTIVRYLWSFGDDKNATGVVVEHSYADDGYYTVVLSIMDDDGDLGFASAMKTILNRPPHASFTASDYTAYPTKPITFNATESYDLDGVIVTYFWEFGDGRNDSGIIVEHDYQSEGNFTVTLTVTDDDGATDNTSATIMVLRRDVAVTALALSKIIIGVGFKVTMNVTVENQGEYDETFNVTVHANMGTIQTKNVFLAIGNSTAITFTWNTTSWTKDSYVIKAVANAVPGETDLDDNILVDGFVLVTFPGDVDGDRDVDVFDLVRIANAYGVKSPDALYDAYCDVDSDGDIDIFDLVLAAGNYGEYW